jgi:hypothetical protein
MGVRRARKESEDNAERVWILSAIPRRKAKATTKRDFTFFEMNVGESVLTGHIDAMVRGPGGREALPGERSAVLRKPEERWPVLAAPSTAMQVDTAKPKGKEGAHAPPKPKEKSVKKRGRR